MPNFEAMYFHLAGKLADTIESLDKLSAHLKEAQRYGENMYIEDEAQSDNNTKQPECVQ